MENNSFRFLPQYLDAFEYLDETDKWRGLYVLAYWGVHKEFPDCATPVDKALVSANMKLIEGSIAWDKEQKNKGNKGGRTPQLSDDQIKGAIIELFEKNGAVPSEKEVLELLGGSATIRNRDIWKSRDKICLEYSKQQTNVSNNSEQKRLFDF